MKAGSFTLAAVLASVVAAMTPAGVFPVSTENMTNFFDVATLAVNGVNIPKANTVSSPTVALDKSISNKTFALVMFDPDTPATGIGGNGTNSFLHWFQDGLTSDVNPVLIGATNGTGGKEVFRLINAKNIEAVQSYVQPSPPVGQTHRYVQVLIDTTGISGFVVSPTVANATATRNGFDMAAFVAEAKVTVISGNFFNVTGV